MNVSESNIVNRIAPAPAVNRELPKKVQCHSPEAAGIAIRRSVFSTALRAVILLTVSLFSATAAEACPFYNPWCWATDAYSWVDENIYGPAKKGLIDVAGLTEDILTLDPKGVFKDFKEIGGDLVCNTVAVSLGTPSLAGIAGRVVQDIESDDCSAGQPIDPRVLNQLKLYFKSSFDDVTVHPNCDLIGSHTNAITFGNNIYFSRGKYNPIDASGNLNPGSCPDAKDQSCGFAGLAHELVHVLQYRKQGFDQAVCHFFTDCVVGAGLGGTASVSCDQEQAAYMQQAVVLEDIKDDGDGVPACAISRRPDEQHQWGPDGDPSHNVWAHSCAQDISDCEKIGYSSKYCQSIDNCPFDFNNPDQRSGMACRVPPACTTDSATNTTTCQINNPIVTQPMTAYDGALHGEIFEAFSNNSSDNRYGVKLPDIWLQPNDVVSIGADGCVQTGGPGNTWRRYVDPQGDNPMYAVLGLIDPNQGNGAVVVPTRLNDVRGKPFRVNASQPLRLGYMGQNDDYSNNGYWAHDDGFAGQCKLDGSHGFGGNAYVSVTIQHNVAPSSYQGSLDGIDCQNITGTARDTAHPGNPVGVEFLEGTKVIGTGTSDSSGRFIAGLPEEAKDGKPHSITARFAGTSTNLTNSPRSAPVCAPSSSQGSLDPVNSTSISGYAWNKDQPSTTLKVAIYVDGTWKDTIDANKPIQNPFVINLGLGNPGSGNPGIGNSSSGLTSTVGITSGGTWNHGFSYPTPASIKDGTPHTISVVYAAAVSTGPTLGTSVNLSGSPQILTAASVSFSGRLDFAGCGGISGYARDTSQPSATLYVDIYDGATRLATVAANRLYQGPLQLQPGGLGGGTKLTGSDYHGFNFAPPASLTDGQPHTIYVKFAGTSDNVTGSPAALALVAPVITGQSDSVTACIGSSASFSVSASGTGLTYQWRKDGNSLSNQTASSMTISSVKAGDAGSYNAMVTGACGVSAASLAATLTISTAGPITITSQPVSTSVCLGQPIALSVSAGGSGLQYQWRKDGVNISGKTGSTLVIPTAAAGDAGNYSVIVSNSCTSVTSANAVVTVNTPPAITSQPVSTAKLPGQPVTFTVTATGSNLHYQWRGRDGGNIAGATSSSYTIPSVGPNDAGSYYVVVYNNCTMLNSAAAILAVNGANNAGFVTQSLPSTMVAGKPYNVSITMKNTGAATWSGLTGYQLVSENPAGNTIWGTSGVNMLPASVTPGNSVTFAFTVTAPAAAGAYHFQWRMVQSGAGFGDLSPDVLISVTPSSGTNNSSFVIQNLPVTMKAGQSYAVSIKMTNSGTTTWTASGGYQLVAQRPAGSTTWGISRIDVPAPVAPGAGVTFAFTITAPAPGSYHFEWQVMQNMAGFGDFSPDVVVTVMP